MIKVEYNRDREVKFRTKKIASTGVEGRQEVKKKKAKTLMKKILWRGQRVDLQVRSSSTISDSHESRGSIYSGKIDDASQHKQTAFSKSGSHVKGAEKQEQAGSRESPVVMKGACFLESSQNCIENL